MEAAATHTALCAGGHQPQQPATLAPPELHPTAADATQLASGLLAPHPLQLRLLPVTARAASQPQQSTAAPSRISTAGGRRCSSAPPAAELAPLHLGPPPSCPLPQDHMEAARDAHATAAGPPPPALPAGGAGSSQAPAAVGGGGPAPAQPQQPAAVVPLQLHPTAASAAVLATGPLPSAAGGLATQPQQPMAAPAHDTQQVASAAVPTAWSQLSLPPAGGTGSWEADGILASGAPPTNPEDALVQAS